MNMNYLTIAEEKIPNTQVLINLISYRTRQLNNGARPMVKRDLAEMDNHDIVLKEIAEGFLTAESNIKEKVEENNDLDFDASILI